MMKINSRKAPVQVKLDARTLKQATRFSELADVPIDEIVAHGFKDWMETVGQVRIHVLENPRSAA